MQRKSYLKLLLILFGYTVMGNLLSTVMTIALAPFFDNAFVKVTAFIFTAAIFHLLTFTAGYKDGLRERKMLELKRVDEIPKTRWLGIGFTGAIVAAVPSLFLLIFKIAGIFDNYLLVFRFLCGAVYPLAVMLGGNYVREIPVYAPFIFIFFYLLTPLFCFLGFNFAVKGNITMNKIIYKQKK